MCWLYLILHPPPPPSHPKIQTQEQPLHQPPFTIQLHPPPTHSYTPTPHIKVEQTGMYLSQKHMLILPGLDIGVHKVLHLTDVLLFQLLETLPTTTHSPCKSQVHLTTLPIWHIYNHSSSINHNTQSLSITGPPHHTAHLAHLQSLLFHQPQHTVLVNYRSTSPHCTSGTFTITLLPSTTTHSPCQLQVHLTTLHIWHNTFTVTPLSSTTIHSAPCHSMHLAERIHNHYSKASVLYSVTEILHSS